MGDTFFSHFIVGAAAAAAFECLKLYDMRHKLTVKKHARLIRSKLFWFVVLGMIAASGFFAWVFYAERPNARAAELALAGIAARSLIRDALVAIEGKSKIKLGERDESSVTLRDML